MNSSYQENRLDDMTKRLGRLILEGNVAPSQLLEQPSTLGHKGPPKCLIKTLKIVNIIEVRNKLSHSLQ